MDSISTEFACKKCGHTGSFIQGYRNNRVSDIATCRRCSESIDVSRARGIEKWNSTISFTMVNPSHRIAIVRLGGKEYKIAPNQKQKISHRGYDLFEYKDEREDWLVYTSVWYLTHRNGWENEVDISTFACLYETNHNSSRKTSWW